MKKLFLACLMLLGGSAWAEWLIYDTTDKSTFYYDPATIRKDGHIHRVWELQDLSKRGKSGEMSLRMRMEYDCKQERYRFLGISGHSEPMAGGTVLKTEVESNDWVAIPPGTVSDRMLKIICTKQPTPQDTPECP